jgi:hypothetical protein
MLSEDILYLSVRELGDRIRSGALSPVELAESYLERGGASWSVSARNRAYCSFVTSVLAR